jgi:uncharacterized protein YcaQ
MLELLSARGEVAVAGRVGRQRLWDVPDRVYPSFEPLSADEAQRRRSERRLRSLGIAVFTVNALHEDVRFSNAMRVDVEAEIEALAAWLGLWLTKA